MPAAKKHDKDKRKVGDTRYSRVGNWNRKGWGVALGSFIEDTEVNFQEVSFFSPRVLQHFTASCDIPGVDVR